MGRLKDVLFLEVWRYLQTQNNFRTLLTSLNSPLTGPQAIRVAWTDLQNNGKMEGLTKKSGLQSVLAERSDLLGFSQTEKGHLLIELTELGRTRSPVEGLPPAPGAPVIPEGEVTAAQANAMLEATIMAEHQKAVAPPTASSTYSSVVLPVLPVGVVSEKQKAELEELAASSFAGVAPAGIPPEEMAQGSFSEFAGQQIVPLDPDTAAAAARRQRAFHYAAGWRAKGKGKGYYMDLVWTPSLAASRAAEKAKENEMVRAMFNTIDLHHGGQSVTLSQIGSDFKVAQLKKDNLFKNVKLLELLRYYEDVFELTPDQATGGWLVKLQPGAQAALPDAEAMLEQELRETDLALPDRIENPTSIKDKMQALRIELLHALSRRGNRVPLQELGQEPRVQQKKAGLNQAKKLVDFIRTFPMNFRVAADETQMMIEAISPNVADTSMIDMSILRNHGIMNQMTGKGGRGKGAGRGRVLSQPYPTGVQPMVQPMFSAPAAAAATAAATLGFSVPEAQTRGFSPQVDAATLAALMQAGAMQVPLGLYQTGLGTLT